VLRERNRNHGTTVVAVLHDLNLAVRFSDHLVLLGSNGLVDVGSPEQVMTEANLDEAFGLKSMIIADPVTGKPMVVPR